MPSDERFRQLGFTENETRLYLLLIEAGKSNAQLLAKRAKIPRTTAYSVLETLVQKGLVSEEQKGPSTYFVANDPSAITRMVQREKKELAKKEVLAQSFAEELKPLFRSKFFSVPRLQFFEGQEGVENMLYEQGETWSNSIQLADKVWWGYQDHTFVEHYRGWLEHYWLTKPESQRIQLLSNDAPVERDLRGKIKERDILPVSNAFDFSSTIWICGDYVILLMTRNEPHYAFQLKDSVFASNMRLLFKLLWTTLRR